MKEFFEELFYMCSSSNTKSRGLYIFIVIAMALLALGGVASLIMLIVNFVTTKAFSILWLALALVTWGVLIAVIIWLKKS